MGVALGPSGFGVVEAPPGEHLDAAQADIEGPPHDVVEAAHCRAGDQDETLPRSTRLALRADQRCSVSIVDLAHALPLSARLGTVLAAGARPRRQGLPPPGESGRHATDSDASDEASSLWARRLTLLRCTATKHTVM